jgi:AAA domain
MTAPAFDTADDALPDVELINFDRKTTHGLPFLLLKDIRNEPISKRHLIKGVMARGETSAWIGPPGSMKSALMAQAAICVSSGTDWHCKKNKGAAGVVYFALERVDLVVRRLRAHVDRLGLGELPIAIVSSPINLMTPKMVQSVIKTIQSAELSFGLPVGLAIFDTFAKLVAAGGGDEDKAKDQGAVFANIQRIKNEIDAHIALIGHTGKDETRGARGSNAILGDVDLMITITGDDIKTATVAKANDYPEGPLFSFKSEMHEFGIDEDGDSISVNIVADAAIEVEQAGSRKFRKRLPRAAQICLRALHQALAQAGCPAPSSTTIPVGQRVVARNEWRRFAYNLDVSYSKEPRARQQAFNRGLDALLLEGAVGMWEDHVWPIS